MFNFNQALKISLREFKSAFVSPIAYIVIVIFLGVQGYFFYFLNAFFLRNQADMRTFFEMLPIVFAFIIPMITMRLFSEEISSGSYEIIATLPLKTMEIIVGKYLSILYFIGLLLVPTIFYPLSIEIVGDLHWGPVVGGYMGAFLLAGAFASIGLFMSTLSKNQIISLITSVTICFGLWIIGKVLVFMPAPLVGVFQHLGTDYHFQNFSKGVFDFRDLLYFASIVFAFLYASLISMREKSV